MSFRHTAAGLILGAAFVYIEFVLATASASWPSSARILDLQPLGWSIADGTETLQLLGSQGVQSYMNIEQSTDLVFPVVYASLLCVLVDATTPTNAGALRRAAILIPAIATVADYFENMSIVSLCGHYISGDNQASPALETLVFLGGRVATPLKWFAVAVSIVYIAASVVSSLCCRTRVAPPPSHRD